MYVCNCNALRDSDLSLAARSGIVSAAEFFRLSGVKPQCGCCIAEVRSAIEGAALAPAE